MRENSSNIVVNYFTNKVRFKSKFLWRRYLLKELDNYEANRVKYKNLDEYMPQMVLFFEKTAKELKD
ncbi:MAG: DUF4932 domain-containing protein [Pyrinomonadaceae bacterium]|nr:DUF4932 domain-containing protein [Pyrinomonadaceae bacterium]